MGSDLIWYCGAWRTPEAIEKRRIADRERKKKKYDQDKDLSRWQNREKYWKHIDKERERSRVYYENNKEVENAKRVS